MEWSEIIKIAGLTSGIQILALIVIGFWGKKIIEYFFNQAIEIKKIELNQSFENYKQKIEIENKNVQFDIDKNLEIYKNKLEILRLEFQVQFADLHVKRSEIIATLYSMLVELNSSMIALTGGIPGILKDKFSEDQEKLNRANTAFQKFSNYYIQNKIYFPKETSNKLDRIQNYIWQKTWDFNTVSNQIRYDESEDGTWKRLIKTSQSISLEIKKEIPKILEDLETEFRDFLGVNNHNKLNNNEMNK